VYSMNTSQDTDKDQRQEDFVIISDSDESGEENNLPQKPHTEEYVAPDEQSLPDTEEYTGVVYQDLKGFEEEPEMEDDFESVPEPHKLTRADRSDASSFYFNETGQLVVTSTVYSSSGEGEKQQRFTNIYATEDGVEVRPKRAIDVSYRVPDYESMVKDEDFPFEYSPQREETLERSQGEEADLERLKREEAERNHRSAVYALRLYESIAHQLYEKYREGVQEKLNASPDASSEGSSSKKLSFDFPEPTAGASAQSLSVRNPRGTLERTSTEERPRKSNLKSAKEEKEFYENLDFEEGIINWRVHPDRELSFKEWLEEEGKKRIVPAERMDEFKDFVKDEKYTQIKGLRHYFQREKRIALQTCERIAFRYFYDEPDLHNHYGCFCVWVFQCNPDNQQNAQFYRY